MFLQHASPEAQVKTLRSNEIGLLLTQVVHSTWGNSASHQCHSASQTRARRSGKRYQQPWKTDCGQRNLWQFIGFSSLYEISWSKRMNFWENNDESVEVGFLPRPTPHIPMNLLGGYQEIDVGQLSLYNFLKHFYMPRRPYGSPILNLQSLQHRTTAAAGLKHSGSRQTTLVPWRALCCKWPSTSSSTEASPPSAQVWTPLGSLPLICTMCPQDSSSMFLLSLLTTDLGLWVSHAHLVESTLSRVE